MSESDLLGGKVRVERRGLIRDERGMLAELCRESAADKLAQVHAVWVYPGKTRGGHWHERKVEQFAVVQGYCCLGLVDRETSEQAKIWLDPVTVVTIPPGVSHRFSCPPAPASATIIVAAVSEEYSPTDPDTFPEEQWHGD